jgi:LysM repeat protein/murein endopeptidase
VTSLILVSKTQALTASYGAPYHGHLENGVPFPTQFPGYQLRDENHTHTTPEVVGALLDAIEAVRTQFPDTCDVYLGDFTVGSGGSTSHHRSHQNGRDVDVGMYAKGNHPLNGLTPMTEDILDAPKTWCLIDNIIRSQRVQYIFLDRRVQRVLYNYAATLGYDQAYLDRVFGNVRGSLIQHVPNHYDHFHVRFFTPWSTLAAHIGEDEVEKRMVIDMAQQSYLPKKVNYYVNGSENSIDALAQSFGVAKKDLCKWNQLGPSSPLIPGSCLVFYKRSFESEPVHLARSLQPGYIAEAPPIRMASLNAQAVQPTATDADRADHSHSVAEPIQRDMDKETKVERAPVPAEFGPTVSAPPRKSSSSAICFASDPKKPNSPTAAYYTAGKRETLQSVSRKSGISINVLCQLNGLKRNSNLKTGQKIKLTQATLPVKPSLGVAACSVKGSAVQASSTKAISQKASRQIADKSAKTSGKSAASASTARDKAKVANAKLSAKSASAAKTGAKASVSGKSAVKGSSQQQKVSKETGKTNKAAAATSKKSAAADPGRKNSGKIGQLAKNTRK